MPDISQTSEQKINPNRITFARKRRGYTKKQLAVALAVDIRTITFYESGEKSPSPANFVKLQQVLGFPAAFFFSDADLTLPPEEGVSYRSLARMTARQHGMAQTQGALAIRLSKWLEGRFELPNADLPDFRCFQSDPEAGAGALRRLWGLGELSIRNTIQLLELHGVRVYSLNMESKEVDAFSWWDAESPFVMLNGFKSSEHSRFDAIHELAHLVLHRHGSSQRNREAESQADTFASAFLMPEGAVRSAATAFPTINTLIQQKRAWKTSLTALTYRLHKLDLITDWHYRSLCIEIGRLGLRTSEPAECERDTSALLPLLFSTLREQDHLSYSAIAQELEITVDELNGLIWGVIPRPIQGGRITPPDVRNRAALFSVRAPEPQR